MTHTPAVDSLEQVIADLTQPRTLSQFMGAHDMALALVEERERIANRLFALLTRPAGGSERLRRRKVIRINWVSEVQNTAGRRALLIATYPVFTAWSITAAFTKAALYAVGVLLVVAPLGIVGSARILTYSMRLRWHHPKPPGENDWVVQAVDDYVERIDAPKSAAFEVRIHD